jgi:hypothetical protein
MFQKIALRSAAFSTPVLLASSLSFAQQPSTPPPTTAFQELAPPSAGSLGVNTKTYSAIVGGAGLLKLGPAGSSAMQIAIGTYEVDFPGDVSSCVYTATIGTSPSSLIAPAFVTVSPREGDADGVLVQTFSVTGNLENHPFNIHVQC